MTRIWIWIGALALLAIAGMFIPAHAHDWYMGQRNPVTGEGCCGGSDCHPLMLNDLARLTENSTYFIVDNKWFFPKSEAMPALHVEEGESGYSFCIWGGKPKCFFYPANV